MSDKYAALTTPRFLDIGRVREIADGSQLLMGEAADLATSAIHLTAELRIATDSFQDAARRLFQADERIAELLAERDADRARIAALEEMADLQRDKIKRLESDLWDEQQLRKVHSQKSFELESENRELKQRNDKDFIWRGQEISRLNDEIDALITSIAAAGISLKIEGE